MPRAKALALFSEALNDHRAFVASRTISASSWMSSFCIRVHPTARAQPCLGAGGLQNCIARDVERH